MKISVIIPAKDSPKELSRLLKALKKQRLRPNEVLVADSSKGLEVKTIAEKEGALVIRIPPEKFNHGLTRTLAAQKSKGDILVFFTQDACPAHPSAIKNLVESLKGQVAAAFGRQISPLKFGVLPFLHRLHNYPSHSLVISLEKIDHLKLRAIFFSNSFSAYKKGALQEIGWFEKVPALEDQLAAAKLLLSGYQLAYVANAVAFHGHPFSFKKEWKRFTDMGRFYAQHFWIYDSFGKPENEARKYILFVWRELKKRKKTCLFFPFLAQQVMRWVAYRWGLCKFRKS